MKRYLRILQPAIVVVVVLAAVWMLHSELTGEHNTGIKEVQPDGTVVERRESAYEILKDGLQDISTSDVAWAVGLTVLNYVIMFGYDWLAIRYLKHPLPLRRLMLASFVGNVASLNFGSLLGGSSVRFRFYALWKFTPLEILQLIVILGLTFWLGVCVLAGIVFLIPWLIPGIHSPIPPTIHLKLPLVFWSPRFEVDVRIVGAALIAAVVGYLAVCALRRRPVKIAKGEVPLPPPWLSVAQIAVSCADLLVVAGVFYILLPDAAQDEFGYFGALGVFLLCWAVAAITHVPGGIGVFEYFNVKLVARQAIASTVVFRVIYLLIPLIVAGCLLLGHELLLDRDLLMKLTPKGHGGSDAAKPSPSQQTSQPNLADAAAAPQQEAHGKAGEDGHCPAREPSSDPTVTKDQA